MSKPNAILTRGISASGKSTFAREWVKEMTRREVNGVMCVLPRVEVNRDDIRRELTEKDGKVFTWDKWNWKREGEVTTIATAKIMEAVENGFDVIVSDTNLNEGRLKNMILDFESHGYHVTVKDFPITLEEAWKRDAKRENGVGHSVIASQYEQWLKVYGRKTYVADKTKPKCILVDIDGTLAHMNGKRGAFEWDKVGVDDVDPHVRTLLELFWNDTECYIIVLSGRDGVSREKTEDWLKDNLVSYDQLIMRTPNDMRKDTFVKEEIFWRDIADNYNVQFVIDDRPSVCRMWRELGLKTFQVGNPHIEF